MAILCAFLIFFLIMENIFLYKIARRNRKMYEQGYHQIEKYRIFFDLTYGWLGGCITGSNIFDWIVEQGYQTVAVYGMGPLGELLYLNLCKCGNVKVKYGLDRKIRKPKNGLAIYDLNSQPETVDLIIVTAVMSYEEIKREIEGKAGFPCKVISLMQLVEEMYIE